MKSVAATRSIVSRSARIAGVEPMIGAVPSRFGRVPVSNPARAGRVRHRSSSKTSAPTCVARPSI